MTDVVPPLSPLQLADLAFDEGEMSVRIEPRYEWGSAPADADPVMSVLLTVTPGGPPLVEGRKGAIAHVILALDLSASMNHPDKYPVLSKALEAMIDDLRSSGGPEILLSVVVFARGAETLLKSVPVSTLDAREVVRAVDACPLRFGNYTDVRGALSRAGRLAFDSHRSDPKLPLRIYLMTDGRPQDVEGAKWMMRERLSRVPVDVDALAFGADADVNVLKDLVCGHRGGTVKHVRTETLGEAYGRIGDVARRVVAKRALLRVELARGVVGGAAYRFRPARHSYGASAFAEGRVFETDLGTLESGRSYSLLFQVRLPQTQDAESAVGDVVLRVPGWGGPREFRATLAIPRHRDSIAIEPDPLVSEARQVLESLDRDDPEALLKALRARRKIYIAERRDPYLLEVVEKAIAELEAAGNLNALTGAERAALTAHTASAGSVKPKAGRREYSFG
jgi:uncharacterized protein YegL